MQDSSAAAAVWVPPCIGDRAGACTAPAPRRRQLTPPLPGANRLQGQGTEPPQPTDTSQHLRCLESASIWAAEISPFCMWPASQCNAQKHFVSGVLQSSNSASLSFFSGNPKGNSTREKPHRGAPVGEESPPVTQHQPQLPHRASAAHELHWVALPVPWLSWCKSKIAHGGEGGFHTRSWLQVKLQPTPKLALALCTHHHRQTLWKLEEGGTSKNFSPNLNQSSVQPQISKED